jgi:hypothetical protein
MGIREELVDIRAVLDKLDTLRSTLIARRDVLERLLRGKELFTCVCVRLNEDLGIRTMSEQEAAGRRGLQLGSVSETLSALKDCPHCKGRGRLNYVETNDT